MADHIAGGGGERRPAAGSALLDAAEDRLEAASRRTALAICGVLRSVRLGLAGSSAGDRDSCVLQGRQQGLKPLVGWLIDREGILCACLAEDDVAVPVLVGAGHGYR